MDLDRLLRLIVLPVTSVVMLAGSAGAQEEQVDLRTSYPEVGLITSGVNAGYWHRGMGIRLSGYYFDENNNHLMLNLRHRLSGREDRQQSINLLLGNINTSEPWADYDFSYIGLAYGANYKGFSVEVGLAKALRDGLNNVKDELVLPYGTMGYVHRFILR